MEKVLYSLNVINETLRFQVTQKKVNVEKGM